MKYLTVKPYYGKAFLENQLFKINNGHNIFYGLKEELKEESIEINTTDQNKQKNTKTIYCDVPYPWEIKTWLKLLFSNKKNNILFCFESPIVNPFSHFKLAHYFFEIVYTWSSEAVEDKKYHRFYIPQLNQRQKTKFNKFENKKFLVLINNNKKVPFLLKSLSLNKPDLYKKRLLAIKYFEKHFPDNFYLYGNGWDHFKVKCKKKVKDKIATLSKFKFCLCFENTVADGYITEKVFDCFKAGCVPVYLGAPNIEEHINKSCYIDFRMFKDFSELHTFLAKIPAQQYQKYISSAQKFMASPEYEKWSRDSFKQILINLVE